MNNFLEVIKKWKLIRWQNIDLESCTMKLDAKYMVERLLYVNAVACYLMYKN